MSDPRTDAEAVDERNLRQTPESLRAWIKRHNPFESHSGTAALQMLDRIVSHRDALLSETAALRAALAEAEERGFHAAKDAFKAALLDYHDALAPVHKAEAAIVHRCIRRLDTHVEHPAAIRTPPAEEARDGER